MMKEFITQNPKETRKLGAILAEDIRSGRIISLSGELGSGKTTFTQGLLKGLGIRGPYASPTFVIMKKYAPNVYHLDAYRVGEKDILDLGWEEITSEPENVVIVEWAERMKEVIPEDSLWIEFEWLGENERRIKFSTKN
jgi:tRNA threonylcarbamoyladenosine biosynthesis protein TsaE